MLKPCLQLHYISLESLFVWLNVAMLILEYKQRSSKNNNVVILTTNNGDFEKSVLNLILCCYVLKKNVVISGLWSFLPKHFGDFNSVVIFPKTH